ncbi:MAG: dTDP-4-dehydrorhamnose reductase [Candidatus Auribacter fodinae]|jgi:dTDP-4-dehydrorhamnose reductase|uniref:dTDP-4-dehydrorhamnose reductase n=1 Tax=Candidatus Auribacter fodinae TaxID=2093366 RepID=A0A3A4R2E1_9BACT|nr:MAG: dTDP-4-dehydrorhamnose reductase [Candidatus Auribacter fodinae]
MRTLVIGKNGMLGSVFRDKEVILPGNCTFLDIDEVDITRHEQVALVMQDIKPAFLVNCSAYTNVDGAEDQQKLSHAINADGVRNLAVECKKYGSKLIHYSTDFIFDGKSLIPYKENDVPHPLNVYGQTKLDGELAIQSVLPEAQYIILRTSWLFGPRGKNFVATMISLAKNKTPLKVVTDQTGSPTFTRDLAKATCALIEKNAAGVFHYCNSGSCSWYEFARYAIDCAGMTDYPVAQTISADFKRPAKRPEYSLLSTERFISVCGYTPRHWHEAVREYVTEYISQQPPV